jgi:hypothetical protein
MKTYIPLNKWVYIDNVCCQCVYLVENGTRTMELWPINTQWV